MDLEKRLAPEDKLVLDVPAVRVSPRCCAWRHGAERWLGGLPLLAPALALPRATCPVATVASAGSRALPAQPLPTAPPRRCRRYVGQATGRRGTALAQGGQERCPVVPPNWLCRGTLGSGTHHSRGQRSVHGSGASHSSRCLVTSDLQRFFGAESDSPVPSRCFSPFRSASTPPCTVRS